jgi:hypothetical protein
VPIPKRSKSHNHCAEVLGSVEFGRTQSRLDGGFISRSLDEIAVVQDARTFSLWSKSGSDPGAGLAKKRRDARNSYRVLAKCSGLLHGLCRIAVTNDPDPEVKAAFRDELDKFLDKLKEHAKLKHGDV